MDASIVSLGVYMLTGAGVTAGGIRFRRIQKRERYHARLMRHLSRLRMYKLLVYLGADVDAYVHTVPVQELDEEMRRCSQCSAVAICDACLRDGKLVQDMNFCPVYRSVTWHSRIFAERR